MNNLKIKLVDGTVYPVVRAEITNGRLEIDFEDKSCEEIQKIFSAQNNLNSIELLNMDEEKYGEVIRYAKYCGVTLVGETKTVILTQTLDVTEQRLISAEADALKARTIAEDLKENGISYEQNAVLSASVMVARANAQALSDIEALKAKAIYHTWTELTMKGFTAVEAGYKFTYDGVLYKTVNANQSFQTNWVPGKGTESIFTRIDEVHAGTLEDPIPAVTNMEYVKGLYYVENGQIYKMNRESMEDGEKIVLQYLPSELTGQYFELAG